EVRIVRIGVDVLQVGPVEEIVELKPDLEVEAFFEAIVFVDRGVGFGKVRASEVVRLFVPFGAERRLGELRQRVAEHAVEERRPRRSLLVVDRVREIVVRAVGVVVATVWRKAGDRIAERRAVRGPKLACRVEVVDVDDGEWIAALIDAGSGDAPSAGQVSYE